jgi:omega-6 fatty acid desaturase (delta-12 desaturase)
MKSSSLEPERQARSASVPQVEPEDLSRYEGEGGRPISEEREKRPENPVAWKEIVRRYQKSSAGRGIWQIINTVVPYAALWYFMYLTIDISWWLTMPLAVLAAAFLVRVFIISHDCGHGSFFKSPRANHILGAFTSFLVFTPYLHWRWEHSLHHASSGDLDRRGTGDIWTLTVQEYLDSSRWKRFTYRLVRNPIILFVIAPMFVFLIKHRFPKSRAGKRQRRSVYWTNLALLGMVVGLSWIFGVKEYLFIQLLIMGVAGSIGVWLFYVQHQFEDVYWERGSQWDYATAALKGSSFYKLPKVLQWFSGNIGFHHIHHLSPKIPNYHLEKCHKAEPLFQTVKPVTLFSSFKAFAFRLWDEQRHKLVSYGHLRTMRRQNTRVLQ